MNGVGYWLKLGELLQCMVLLRVASIQRSWPPGLTIVLIAAFLAYSQAYIDQSEQCDNVIVPWYVYSSIPKEDNAPLQELGHWGLRIIGGPICVKNAEPEPQEEEYVIYPS